MSYIPRTCPRCGANLDPGESCDCVDESITQKTHKTGNGEDPLSKEQIRQIFLKHRGKFPSYDGEEGN